MRGRDARPKRTGERLEAQRGEQGERLTVDTGLDRVVALDLELLGLPLQETAKLVQPAGRLERDELCQLRRRSHGDGDDPELPG